MERINSILKTLPDNALILIHSALQSPRNHDVLYPFRQSSLFYYLTELNEPMICMAISNSEDSVLYYPPTTERQKMWDGESMDPGIIQNTFQLNQKKDIKDLNTTLQPLLDRHHHLVYDFSCPVLSSILSDHSLPDHTLDLKPFIDAKRLIKDQNEIQSIRKAIDISVQAHLECMQKCKDLTHEYQIEATFLHKCHMLGAPSQAYPSIVASGKNACILHYVKNDQKLNPGDLLLIDAGCEYNNYASDITRTYPINGQFSQEQKLIYQAVLDAQKEAITSIKPGVTWVDLQQQCKKNLTKNCIEIGLLQGSVSDNLSQKTIDQFYYHGLGHWLGLDVHDAGLYQHSNKDPVSFHPNMVLTIEPGLYIRPHPKIDPKWWNIGVRIEDNVLVLEDGCEVLSRQLPKSVEDLEHIIGA